MIESGFLGVEFNNFLHFRIYGHGFCKNGFIDEHFQHFRIHGYDFQKISRIYGWCSYDLNGRTLYLGNSTKKENNRDLFPPVRFGSSSLVTTRDFG